MDFLNKYDIWFYRQEVDLTNIIAFLNLLDSKNSRLLKNFNHILHPTFDND